LAGSTVEEFKIISPLLLPLSYPLWDSEFALTLVAGADRFQSRHRTHPVRGKGRAHLSNLS